MSPFFPVPRTEVFLPLRWNVREVFVMIKFGSALRNFSKS